MTTAAPPVPSPPGEHTLRARLLFLASLALTAIVYYPLTKAYFYADDFDDFFIIENKPLTEFLVCPQGGHLYLMRDSLVYLFRRLFGLRPELYFGAELLTHLLNVCLLFLVIRRLTASSHLAAFGSALWGICPAHADPLAWYSVYGQVVTATILLLVLSQAAPVASADRPLTGRAIVVWTALLLAATTCFGVGIGAAMVSPVVFLLLLPPSGQRARLFRALCLLALALPFLYRGFFRLCALVSGSEAVMTGAGRPLDALLNAKINLIMLGSLLSYGVTTLLAGFLSLQRQYPDTLSHAVTATYLAALAVAFARARGRQRRQLVAFLLLAMGCYGMIAVGRAFFNPSNLGCAGATPRYHYVASIPVAIVLCLVLALLGQGVSLRAAVKDIVLVTWAGWSLLLYAHAPSFIDLRGFSRHETTTVLESLRSAIAAGRPGGDVYVPNRPFMSMGPVLTPHQELFPGWAGVFTVFFPSNVVDGRRVHFVVDDPEVVQAHRSGKRTADLLMTSDQARPAGIVVPPSARTP